MGMFDNVVIEYPLPECPEGYPNGWQTKDTPDQFIIDYRITPEGRLMRPITEYDAIPEDERPNRFAAIRSTKTGEEDTNWHGYLNFYHEIEGEWFEYNAKFTDGVIVEVERINKREKV